MGWISQYVQGSMTLAAVIQAAAAVIGFFVVIYQLFQLRRNLRGATQDRLYAHYMEICKLFMQNPELRPFFYRVDENVGTAPATEQTEDSRQKLAPKVAFMCEAILGLVEHAVLQKKNMPKDAWENCWRPYALERLEQSEALEKFFDPNAHWYSEKMCQEMKSMKRDLDRKRAHAAGRADTRPKVRVLAP
jgi:hypothetical protein